METAFIKQNGIVKEVLISAIRCERDKENDIISVKTTKCLHQGEEIGWGKRTYYKDKLCTELLDFSCVYYKFGSKQLFHRNALQSFDCQYNDNGTRACVKVYAMEINYISDEHSDAIVTLANYDDDTILDCDKVFNSVEDYDWYNETTVHHNDGSVEIIGGHGKNWEFNDKQTELIEKFKALQQEMRDNKIRIVWDNDDWDLYAINEEHMEIAINSPYGNGEEVEGCSEWERIPSKAWNSISRGWTSMGCDDTIHYRKREE